MKLSCAHVFALKLKYTLGLCGLLYVYAKRFALKLKNTLGFNEFTYMSLNNFFNLQGRHLTASCCGNFIAAVD